MIIIMALLEVQNLKKIYSTRFGGNKVQALEDISFSVENGEYVAIMGESGSGKTTLLNLLASLDKPTSGDILLDGMSFSKIKHKDYAPLDVISLALFFRISTYLILLRSKIIFFFHLFCRVKAIKRWKNVLNLLPNDLLFRNCLTNIHMRFPVVRNSVLLLQEHLLQCRKYYSQMNRQVHLIQRRLAHLMKIFGEISADGQTILMVTHSIQAASCANRILFIKDGRLFNQIYRGDANNEEMFKRISDSLTVLQTGVKENG
jgi:putative ABC transport system ATP-binding protein